MVRAVYYWKEGATATPANARRLPRLKPAESIPPFEQTELSPEAYYYAGGDHCWPQVEARIQEQVVVSSASLFSFPNGMLWIQFSSFASYIDRYPKSCSKTNDPCVCLHASIRGFKLPTTRPGSKQAKQQACQVSDAERKLRSTSWSRNKVKNWRSSNGRGILYRELKKPGIANGA